MRHAERPADQANPDLSEAGFQRAKELAPYIRATFGTPAFLFAAAPSPHSNRPVQTIEPLSKAIDVTVDQSIADKDYEDLANKLLTDPRYLQKLTVVCWHHEKIPKFAHALNASHGDYPDPWGDDVFNLILKFDFDRDRPKVTQIVETF
jgi:broad specificity phosphatase PhoE